MANNSKTQKTIIISILILAGIIFMSSSVFAAEKIISNSGDWKDVYSSMLYASLTGKQPGLFLTSSKHGSVILYSIPKETNGTLIFSSRSTPYIVNYRATMEAAGYRDVEELTSNTLNLDIAKRLSNENSINKYIIVDDAYGYNALSVASYAVLDKYYVILASERNIGQIDSFFSDKRPDKIIIYGQVDEAVKTRLADYDPETINTGDRFSNNIEIVKRYQQIKHSKQALISNGEFIEASIMSGEDPVLFIGRGNVPQQIQDYLKQSEFQVLVLIGNEFINPAQTIRRQTGISVFVKFAQGARTPTGTIASVEDLDKFPIPKYSLNLELYSIVYNKATGQLWVTYRNKANIGTYLKGTITITDDGQKKVLGDQDAIFIDKNQYKTINYDVVLEGENITAHIYTLFGEGKKSLENILEGDMAIEKIEILDDSALNITSIVYDKGAEKFIITVENIGTVDTYVSAELLDIYVNGEYLTISSPEAQLLKAGKSANIPVEVALSEQDIENNPTIKAKVYYGERENSLIKTIYGEYEFKFAAADIIYYALIVLVIILLGLLIFGRKKCPHCHTHNSRLKKICKKCGHNLYHKKDHKDIPSESKGSQ